MPGRRSLETARSQLADARCPYARRRGPVKAAPPCADETREVKRTIAITLAAFAALGGVAATALGSSPATAHDRSSMARAVQQWIRPYGGGNCRLVRQRVSTVDRSWASAWVGGHCGSGSAGIYGDLVVFHHNGQDRPGVWRVKGVWNDPGACSRVPTRVLVDLGVAGNEEACAREYEEAQSG